ncbi:hypothetical protein KB151_003872 [[Clostridium] innocuum]|nr:hypothetical protein [[Clostridium] innocuum]
MNVNVIGYVLVNERYKDKYYFKGTVQNITRFIMQYGQGKNVRIVITDRADEFMLSTYGEFLDEVVDEVYDKIIAELVELQQGKKYEPLIFEQTEPYVMKLVDKLEE